MSYQDIFQTCLATMQEARLYFDQGLTEEAIQILETTLYMIEGSDIPLDKQKNLINQIQSYLNTWKKVAHNTESMDASFGIDSSGEELDPEELYKHTQALFNGKFWEEAIQGFKKVAAFGYHVMECWELCGDCSVSLEKWEEALHFYEMVYNDPSTPAKDRKRLEQKIARCRKVVEQEEAGKEAPPEKAPVLEDSGEELPTLREDQVQAAVQAKREKEGEPPEEAVEEEAADQGDQEVQLQEIYRLIQETEKLDAVLPRIEKKILELLGAERFTIYQRGRSAREIVSKYATGVEDLAIRLPLSSSSIAGFVALNQRPLLVNDVHDKTFLASIHPELKFDESHDKRFSFRTRSMLTVPIKTGDTLLGVLQIINRSGEGVFTDADLKHAQDLSSVIGHKFQFDLKATESPFEYLLLRGKITQEELDEITKTAAKKKKSVAFTLHAETKLSIEEIGESLERYYQVPFLQFDPDIQIPRSLLKNLSLTYLKSNRWLPVAGNREKAVILIDDPNDSNRIMEIQQVLNARSYEFRVGISEEILQYLGDGRAVQEEEEPEEAYHEEEEEEDQVELAELVGKLEDEEALEEENDLDEGMASVTENEAAVVQIVNRLIIDATRLNASDIHVEPSSGKKPAIVRMRVDGVCREVLKIPSSHIRAVIARIKIMSKLDIAERRKPQDGKIMTKFRRRPIELRVATIPTVNGESAVLRVLAGSGVLPFEKLNLSKRNNDETLRQISHPHGMFLVVGPTGSGKTTTLHAILGKINTPERKIWTAEDPVEITQPGLQQVQVQHKIGFDFAAAMRSFLRADPDVILIGEMRDRETSHIGVEASLTGHLVFSTLHTNSAPETIVRLLDLGLDPLNFADALLGVLAQRLVRTLCDSCKEPYQGTDEEIDQLVKMYGEEFFPELEMKREEITLYKPVGCGKCQKTGYRGRTGIHELLVATPAMKKLIARSAPVNEIRDLALKESMRTLMQDGVWKILKGQTDLAQLRRVTAG